MLVTPPTIAKLLLPDMLRARFANVVALAADEGEITAYAQELLSSLGLR
jgi:hypothetical protein